MIVTTVSGRGFAGLARYLARGRSGREADRVAWTSARHLATADPELAAVPMRATAAQSARVRQPVYHLALSFDPDDAPRLAARGQALDQAFVEGVVDRVLGRLGLAEHQAMLVAHRDHAHPHVHVMVNRVHPETHRAWERWQDRPAIERALREEEQRLGLREVPGRLAPTPDGRALPRTPAHADDAGLTKGERQQRDRHRRTGKGEAPLVERVRAHAPVFLQAESWDEFETACRWRGLALVRQGPGVAMTTASPDGSGRPDPDAPRVKLTRVHRALSSARLAQRFGQAFAAYQAERAALLAAAPELAALTPLGAALARARAPALADAVTFTPAERAVDEALWRAAPRGPAGEVDELRVATAEGLAAGRVVRGWQRAGWAPVTPLAHFGLPAAAAPDGAPGAMPRELGGPPEQPVRPSARDQTRPSAAPAAPAAAPQSPTRAAGERAARKSAAGAARRLGRRLVEGAVEVADALGWLDSAPGAGPSDANPVAPRVSPNSVVSAPKLVEPFRLEPFRFRLDPPDVPMAPPGAQPAPAVASPLPASASPSRPPAPSPTPPDARLEPRLNEAQRAEAQRAEAERAEAVRRVEAARAGWALGRMDLGDEALRGRVGAPLPSAAARGTPGVPQPAADEESQDSQESRVQTRAPRSLAHDEGREVPRQAKRRRR